MTPMKGNAILFAAACAICSASPAWSQQAVANGQANQSNDQSAQANSTLSEVVVTAQFRSENIMQTPLSIQAVSGAQLAASNVTNVHRLQSVAPNLIISGAAGAQASFYIRGVGVESTNGGSDPAVGLNVDGVSITRPSGINAQFYDLDRVEVLNGPQGTLYGRNTTGGAINVLHARPNLARDSGYVEVGGGTYSTFKTDGALNLPVNDKVGLRAAFQTVYHDGYLSYGADNEASKAGRLSFLAKPNEQFTFYVAGDWYQNNAQGNSYAPACTATTVATPGASCDTFDLSRRRSYLDPSFTALYPTVPIPAPQTSHLNDTTKGVQAQGDYKVDFGTLTLISSYRKTDFNTLTPLGGMMFAQDGDLSTVTDELRFTTPTDHRLYGTAGIYYLLDIWDANGNNPGGENYLPLSATPSLSYYYKSYDSNTLSKAAYADGTLRLVDGLRVFGGLRYTEETKSYIGFQTYPNRKNLTLNINSRSTTDKVTYRAGFEWEPVRDLIFYASDATGFHSGGFFLTTLPKNSFAPEQIQAYTIGTKAALLDHRLKLTLEGFDWEYDNRQVSQIGVDPTGVIVFITTNAARSTDRGFEATADLRVGESTNFNADILYLDTNNTNFVTSSAAPASPSSACRSSSASGGFYSVDCSGTPLLKAPRWTLNFGAVQTIPLSDGARVVLRGQVRYMTSYYLQPTYMPFDVQPAYATGDLGVEYHDANDLWTVAMRVTNINNQIIRTNDFNGANGYPVSAYRLAPPRVFELDVKRSF